MLNTIIQDYQLVLGSNSPRRKQYLEELGLQFIVRSSDIDESYPQTLVKEEISNFIAEEKSKAIIISPNELLITSDTIVWNKGIALGKPATREEAIDMIKALSNNTHEVITSVCLRSVDHTKVFHVITEVTFIALSFEEIAFYVDHYKPFDKAGGYGIQEWIGLIGIDQIKGSYTNIVGLPTTQLIQELKTFTKTDANV